MTDQVSQLELQEALDAVIEKMKDVQQRISADSQPASMHELDALSELGRRYGEIIERLQSSIQD